MSDDEDDEDQVDDVREGGKPNPLAVGLSAIYKKIFGLLNLSEDSALSSGEKLTPFEYSRSDSL